MTVHILDLIQVPLFLAEFDLQQVQPLQPLNTFGT